MAYMSGGPRFLSIRTVILSIRVVQGFPIRSYLGARGSQGSHPSAQPPPYALPKYYPLERTLPAFLEEVEAWEWTPPAWGSERYQEGERQNTGQAYPCLRPGHVEGGLEKQGGGGTVWRSRDGAG